MLTYTQKKERTFDNFDEFYKSDLIRKNTIRNKNVRTNNTLESGLLRVMSTNYKVALENEVQS